MVMKLGAPTIIIVQSGVYYLRLLFIATSLLISSYDACPLDGCDHPDCGSCGNACCSLFITVHASTEFVMNKLNSSISYGGPDNLYLPMMTDEGTLTFYDRRPYKQEKEMDDGADFIGQALHTTLNGKYNDTLDFTLSPTTIHMSDKDNNINNKNNTNNNNTINEEATIIAAFSISDSAGAYCDSGQNYWNIIQLVQGIQWDDENSSEMSSLDVAHVGNSCPAKVTAFTVTTTATTIPIKEETNNYSSPEDKKKDVESDINIDIVSHENILLSLQGKKDSDLRTNVKYTELRDNNVDSTFQDMLPLSSFFDSTVVANSEIKIEFEIEVHNTTHNTTKSNNNNNDNGNVSKKNHSYGYTLVVRSAKHLFIVVVGLIILYHVCIAVMKKKNYLGLGSSSSNNNRHEYTDISTMIIEV